MIPEIGTLALILALLLSITQAVLPLAGAQRGNRTWMAVARPAAWGQFTFTAIAYLCLVYAFLTNDFTVINVASNSILEPAGVLPSDRHLGFARRLAAVLVADPGRLDHRGRHLLAHPARRHGGARARRHGSDLGRLPVLSC